MWVGLSGHSVRDCDWLKVVSTNQGPGQLFLFLESLMRNNLFGTCIPDFDKTRPVLRSQQDLSLSLFLKKDWYVVIYFKYIIDLGHCPKSSNKPCFVFCEVWWFLGMIFDSSFARSLSEQTTSQVITRMSFRCSTSYRCRMFLLLRLRCCSFCESWLGKRSVRFPVFIFITIGFPKTNCISLGLFKNWIQVTRNNNATHLS